jgi:hypothetical protein
MKLLTFEHDQRMRANGVANASRAARAEDTEDYQPAVKLFCPWGAGTWLLTELDPEDPDIAFGLCDLGMGFAITDGHARREQVSLYRILGYPEALAVGVSGNVCSQPPPSAL